MQHGLERSSGRDGLNCWSWWYDSSGWGERQKGFSGGKSRPTVIVGCSRPLRAQDRWFFDSCFGAPRRQLNAKPFGVRGASVACLFVLWMRRISLLEGALCHLHRAEARGAACGTSARCAGSPLCRRGTNARGADCPLCRAWYEGPLCGAPVLGSVIMCSAWFPIKARYAGRDSVRDVVPDRGPVCRRDSTGA
jgi:hypothetical protein